MGRELSRSGAWLMFIALVVVIGVNAAANMLPINDQTTGEVADQLGLLFTPPSFVFSIWGFIYLSLIIWLMKFLSRNGRSKSWAAEVKLPFLFAAFGNIGWIISFHYEWFYITMLFMIILFISLIIIHYHISESRSRGRFDLFPISIYLGWISVALILNVGIVAVTAGADPIAGFLLSGQAWTILIVIVSTIVAILVMTKRRDSVYPLVFIWALSGIGVERAEDYELVAMTSWIMIITLLLAIMIHLFKRR